MSSGMTIGKRFLVTTGLLMFFCLALAIVALWGFNSITGNVDSIAKDTSPGLAYSMALKADTYELRGTYLRRFSEDADGREIVDQMITKSYAQAADDATKYDATIFADEDRKSFTKLQAEIELLHQNWSKVLPLSNANKQTEAFDLYKAEVKPQIDVVLETLTSLAADNQKAEENNLAETVSVIRRSNVFTMITACLSLLLGIGISWLMITSLNKQMARTVRELTEGAEQISSAASQVSASSQSLAQGSSQQAASLEETSSSSEEINSMARKNTDNSRSMAALVSNSQDMFTKTNHQLEEMVVSMDEINQSSGKISKIIKVIDEIAFQTNILALNAAVEAARAGEAGMGFAVVADEVRNLAQRSAQAAKDTAGLIEESISKSNGGKVKVDQVAKAIRGITEDAGKIKTLVDEVTLGSEEQSRGLEQIAKAISQMEQVTQTTAANAEESAAAAEELSAQSQTLKEVVIRLTSMVGSKEETETRKSFRRRPLQSYRTSAESGNTLAITTHFGAPASARTSSGPKPIEGGGRPVGPVEEKDSFPLEASFKAF